MPHASTHQVSIVSETGDLKRVLDACRAEGRFALDTEFLREKTYRARLCLVQVCAGNEIFLIDPLEDVPMEDLAALVGDPSLQVIVHAGKQDFELLNERFGVVPANVFDVQVAAGFIGLGASLAYGALVGNLLDVHLQKGEAYSDWCRRPLTDAQLTYAADDVRWLLPLVDKLENRLADMQRIEWVQEEMASFEDPDSYGVSPDQAWRKVTGRGTLSGRQAAVLREVAAWREEAAARRDIPRGWLVKDPTLVEIARRSPSSPSALRSIRGFNAKEVDRSAPAIIAAVERGKKAPPVETPSAPPKKAQLRARMLAGLADAVVRARCDKGKVATELVATRGELEALLTHIAAGTLDESRHRLMRGWRKEMAGNAVVEVARGNIALRASDKPPYIEEVDL